VQFANLLRGGVEDLEQTIAENQARQDVAEAQQGLRHTAPPRRNHGALPEHLPRYEVLIDVEQGDCSCCGSALHAIGGLRTEQLDIVPAQLRVRVTRRPPVNPLDGSTLPRLRGCRGGGASAGAADRWRHGDRGADHDVLVSKFCDSLPLYRQAQMLARQGVTLDRSTLSNWVGQAGWWLTPLYDLILGTALSLAKLLAEDTTLSVLDPGRGRIRTGRLGAMRSITCHGAGLGTLWRPMSRKGIRPTGTSRRSVACCRWMAIDRTGVSTAAERGRLHMISLRPICPAFRRWSGSDAPTATATS
jgi:transposase